MELEDKKRGVGGDVCSPWGRLYIEREEGEKRATYFGEVLEEESWGVS